MSPGVTIFVFLWLLFVHWFADFVLQPDAMAKEKSRDNAVLLAHVLAYTVALVLLSAPLVLLLPNPWRTVLILAVALPANVVVHFAIDYVTSRINSRLWAEKRVHDFFVSVGFDQFLHHACLALMAWFLVAR